MQSTARTFRARHFFGAFAFLALVTAAACGDGADVSKGDNLCKATGCGEACTQTTDCAAGLFCVKDKCVQKSSYDCKADYGANCGKSCDQQSDCVAGTHCSLEWKCTAQCKEAADCGSGYRCTTDGRCVAGPSIPDGNGGAGGGAGCINEDVTFEPQTPTVMLLVDRSGSMNAPDNTFAGAPAWTCNSNQADWRWNVARYVLMHPTEGVVKPLEGEVRFGQVLYSGYNQDSCPELSGIVQPALNNHAAMLAQFPCSEIQEDTPTGPSLQATVQQLTAFNEPGPKIIVLATDGEPDDCTCPDFGQGAPAGCNGAAADAVKADVVTEATAASNAGITVHTILMANEDNSSLWAHVQDVAEAGGGNAYAAYDVEELKNAFSTIVNGARSCIIDLDGRIAAGKEGEGSVVFNGVSLTLNDDDGWRVNTPSQIELLGAACETLKDSPSDPSLQINFPCGTYVPDIK